MHEILIVVGVILQFPFIQLILNLHLLLHANIFLILYLETFPLDLTGEGLEASLQSLHPIEI